MKKYILILLVSIIGISCEDVDNYEAPSSALEGTIINKNTGKGIPVGVSDSSIRIRLLENNWSENPTSQYLRVRKDGSYANTKLFDASYAVNLDGAVVPLDKDTMIILKAGEKTVVDFRVEPIFMVEWVGEPVFNTDNTVTVDYRVTRGTNRANYQYNLNATFLAIGTNEYVDTGGWINGSTSTTAVSDANLGETMRFTSGALVSGRSYYLRIGARNAQTNRYNYNDALKVKMP
ncbi:MAG: DUF3823 domain-containing protein [Bacteroidales bacterium]